MRRGRTAIGLLVALALAARAGAQPRPTQDAEANALWADGRRLMDAGDTAAACTKFEASLAIVPKLGTRLNLGHCYEMLGRIASAWSAFQTAAAQARQTKDSRETFARQRAAALERRVSRLIVAAPPVPPRGLEVTRDGVALGGAVLGQAVPVDPGEHHVAARAPGHEGWETKVHVEREGETLTVRIPALVRLPDTAPPPAPTPPATLVADRGDPARSRRIVAAAVGGAGVAAIVAGTVVVLSAKSDWDASRSDCDDDNVCGDAGFDQATRARRKATVATVLFAGGAAAIGAGVVLWLTAPKRPRAAERARWQITPELGPSGGAIAVTGSF